jgi:RimJ/RimL family protein N-acetyltransferase
VSQPLGELVKEDRAKLPSREAIEGRIVSLRPINPSHDLEALFHCLGGPDNEGLWTYLASGPFPRLEQFGDFLTAMAPSTDPLAFAIVNNAREIPTGIATYLRIEPKHRVVEIGHLVFSALLQKTTGATEAIYLMARHAFDHLGYRRLEWKCNSLHLGSRAAALRYGFTFEGIFRQHMIVKGRNRDTAWFSITDAEWPAIRSAFETWLDPSNFDEEGCQQQSLASLRSAGE